LALGGKKTEPGGLRGGNLLTSEEKKLNLTKGRGKGGRPKAQSTSKKCKGGEKKLGKNCLKFVEELFGINIKEG